MRGSAKRPEPRSLNAWKVTQRENGIALRYDDLQNPEKAETAASLYREQTGQCVYCGRGINLAQKMQYHIEHFRPRYKYPHLQLDYTNLFLSCGPDSESGRRGTCGDKKDDWFEEDMHIPPVPDSCAERFQFSLSGEIAGDGEVDAEKMIEVLNLNHPALMNERRSIVEHLESQLKDGISPDELRQGFSYTGPDGTRPSFANVAIRYLNQWVPTVIY